MYLKCAVYNDLGEELIKHDLKIDFTLDKNQTVVVSEENQKINFYYKRR